VLLKMPRSGGLALRDGLNGCENPQARFLWGAGEGVSLDALRGGSRLSGRLREFAGRSVLVATRDQLATAVALIELDGLARRLVLCPPDVPAEHLPAVIASAEVNAVVSDLEELTKGDFGIPLVVPVASPITPMDDGAIERCKTEWVLLTSGTTGAPKMLIHSLAGLTGGIRTTNNVGTVWGTFYDIRRYGGLQIFFRSVLGGGSFVLSSVDEPIGDYLARLGAHAATHVLGTPSHWRRALMSPSAGAIAPQYVRLSGEVADQAILDALRGFYPGAMITHAFASTESGVGFEVTDGLEGFPTSVLGVHGDVEIKVVDGSLRFRSSRTASRYVGRGGAALMDDDGFVDTGDMVEGRGERYYFLGRRSGIINVGGLKVHPEEVEAVINRHPAVRMSLVRSKRNPITGSIVVADVVLKEHSEGSPDAECRRGILRLCQQKLSQHKVPAMIQFVPVLSVAPAGKLTRHGA
jgi:acyl-coenzyme A synthetase/AMP-(fatty) acid ligase